MNMKLTPQFLSDSVFTSLAIMQALDIKKTFTLSLTLLALPFAYGDYPDDMSNWDSAVAPYMTPELRDRVNDLRRSVAISPSSTPEQLEQRAVLLWEWSNAYALTGRAVHPILSQDIARIRQAPVRQRQVDTYGPIIDWYIREFSFQDAFPSAIGALESADLGPFPADGFAELTQTYTVGNEAIRVGGGFLIATRDHRGSLNFQAEDPSSDNWINAFSSNPEVELEVSSLDINGMFSGSLGADYFPRPYFRVSRGTLNPGDSVTIVMGDRSSGSRGMRLPAAASSALRIRVWVSLQNPDELFSLNELPFHTEGLAATTLRGFVPSVASPNEEVMLSVRSEDQFRNRATGNFKSVEVFDGERKILDLTASDEGFQIIDDYRFTEEGVHYLTAISTDGELLGEFNPILVIENPAQRIYWGETHGHTGFAEGSGTVENFFRFAKEDARLDFMTLSEHDLWLDDWEWEVLREEAIASNINGKFITYLGWEWTRPPTLGGHHNVLFRTAENRRRVEVQRAPEVSMLYELLKEENSFEDVLVIPHAHNPGRWWESDPEVEHLVEIVSNHGTFEWLGRAFLREGFHLGFIGGSDDHIGHPGIRPLNNARSGSDNFGGMAAVLAPELDSDVLFDAMRNKQTYATNGQKIILQLNINNQGMGQAIQTSERVRVDGRVVGTDAISNIDLIKNGELFRSQDLLAANQVTGKLELRFNSDSDPMERNVRSRGYRIWRGTITIENASIEDISLPNVENIYTESAKVSEHDSQAVEFFMRTRGAPRSIMLSLGEISEDATISLSIGVANSNLTEEFSLSRLNADGKLIVSQQQDFQDQLLVRWVESIDQRDREFTFLDETAKSGDSYYLRVTQINGGMAWSSPVKME